MSGASDRNERFLILARQNGSAAEALSAMLNRLGDVEVILDRPGDEGIWHDDDLASGFRGMMGRTDEFPEITSWSRAMFHLSSTLKEGQAVWFVEDDVAGDLDSFTRLVEVSRCRDADLAAIDVRSRDCDPDWYFWSRYQGFFEMPCAAFQPLCRLSSRLVEVVLDFQAEHGYLIFHEVLFASLAKERGMAWHDWSEDPQTCELFPEFRFRPLVEFARYGISHPVKSADIHSTICGLPMGPEEPRFSRYQDPAGPFWYEEEFLRWKRSFFTTRKVKALEVGIGHGKSANLLLDEVFTNPSSEVHGIVTLVDHPEGWEDTRDDRRIFESNARLGNHLHQITLYEGLSSEVLAWMISTEGFWEDFDFIHINGDRDDKQVLADACQAWLLLKTGGVMVLSDNHRDDMPSAHGSCRSGIDSFLNIFGKDISLVFEGDRTAFRKR